MNTLSKIVCSLVTCVLLNTSVLADANNGYLYTKELFHQTNDPIQGNPKGNVSLVEFLDYECPYCIEMSSVIDRLSQENPQLRVVYKELSIHGEISDFAAAAVLAANKQGKFVKFHQALMSASRPLTHEIILSTAKSVGLNMTKLQKDMNDPAILDKLRADYKLADDLQVQGTPTFYIGKTNAKATPDSVQSIFGEVEESELQAMINSAK